ncbi:MAG: glycosyltransferase, partial [Vicinamibacterales bacterium]
NASPFLGAALDSVFRQTFADFELLLIDDGSSDETPAVAARYRDARLRYVRHEDNAGLANRLNEGLQLARAEYIARLDADDVAHPERLARQVARLDANPSLALVGANAVNITADGLYASGHYYPLDDAEVLWYSCVDSPFNHSVVTYRRSILWNRLGGYNGGLRYCEDFDMWGRLTRAGYRGGNLDDVLVAYRQHGSQMTTRMPELRLRINVDIITANLKYALPTHDGAGLDAMGAWIADVNFGRRPCSPEFVAAFNGLFREFVETRGLSPKALRRVQAAHFLRWGSFSRAHSPLRAMFYAFRAATLSPARFNVLVLPRPVRNRLASRLGYFWEASSPAVPAPAPTPSASRH